MWFDAQKALAEIEGGDKPLSTILMSRLSRVSQRTGSETANSRPNVAVVATGAVEKHEFDKATVRRLPTHPPACAVCGLSDWMVAVTDRTGRRLHVACSKQDRELAQRRPDGRAEP